VQDWLVSCLLIAAAIELAFARDNPEAGQFAMRMAAQRLTELHLYPMLRR
jgi:HAMP domain-containing protein